MRAYLRAHGVRPRAPLHVALDAITAGAVEVHGNPTKPLGVRLRDWQLDLDARAQRAWPDPLWGMRPHQLGEQSRVTGTTAGGA